MDQVTTQDVEQAIKDTVGDKEKMASVADSIRQNPHMFQEMAKVIETNPDLKKAAVSGAATKQMKTQIAGMSAKEKQEMQELMKSTRSQMESSRIKGVRITQNGQIKSFFLQPSFPVGSIYDQEPYTIEAGSILVYTTTASLTRNKVAQMIIGEEVFGEVVLVTQGRKGTMEDLSVEVVTNLKKRRVAQAKANTK
jgi:hypothetical protein